MMEVGIPIKKEITLLQKGTHKIQETDHAWLLEKKKSVLFRYSTIDTGKMFKHTVAKPLSKIR